MLWATILTVLVLLIITYEDFKNRSVHFFLFPILAILLIYTSLHQNPLEVVAMYTGFNILYLVLIMTLCYGYIYIKYRSLAILKFIGIGDVLFFISIALWFKPIGFVLFNTATFITALAFHLLFSRLSPSYIRFNSVPLAGFQSVCLAAVILYNYIALESYG